MKAKAVPSKIVPYVFLIILSLPIILGFAWILVSTFSYRAYGLVPINKDLDAVIAEHPRIPARLVFLDKVEHVELRLKHALKCLNAEIEVPVIPADPHLRQHRL